jgi:hypothetical protein
LDDISLIVISLPNYNRVVMTLPNPYFSNFLLSTQRSTEKGKAKRATTGKLEEGS